MVILQLTIIIFPTILATIQSTTTIMQQLTFVAPMARDQGLITGRDQLRIASTLRGTLGQIRIPASRQSVKQISIIIIIQEAMITMSLHGQPMPTRMGHAQIRTWIEAINSRKATVLIQPSWPGSRPTAATLTLLAMAAQSLFRLSKGNNNSHNRISRIRQRHRGVATNSAAHWT